MSDESNRKLALDLLHADTETAVISILKQAGYWDDDKVWRDYGDTETNYATIGNQQSRPEAALAEKVVNCVDARLLAECYKRGIDPQSNAAPKTITDAVAAFFEPGVSAPGQGGHLKDWPQDRQREQARSITIAITGAMPRGGNASITIADLGEGQVPSRVPDTFLSINRGNKLRIPFVQGKFNMGGTGALKFCGKENLQLLITKRNQDVAKRALASSDADAWGFTVVRRERPVFGAGRVRNSVYRYLAPVEAANRQNRGDILTFHAATLPAMPEQNRPYSTEMESGSIIKLYEYDMKGFRSHALMGDGLLSRLELLLPGIALPVRVHECRAYGGEAKRSFENSLVGLLARMEEGRGGNLEDGYPTSLSLKVRGEEMVAQIFAFKEGKAESYAANEGIIFVINGQTHGAIPRTFFERRRVRMQRLAKSLLIVVDCSAVSVGAREDLFMNSRDRLSNGELRRAIEEELEDAIGKHAGLLALQDQRRQSEIADRLSESKPLEDVLGSILKSSPSLSRLFLAGQRLSKPHKQTGSEAGISGGGTDNGNGVFHGRTHPTYFRFQGKPDNADLKRSAELGRRCRIKFETDVTNDYFSRDDVRGRYHVEVLDGALEGEALDHNLTLHDGVANWSINLPEDALLVGDVVTIACTVTDPTLVAPIVNIARVTMAPKSPDQPGGDVVPPRGARGKQPGSTGAGNMDDAGSKERGGLQMPTIIRVHNGDANWSRYKFEEREACVVVEESVPDAAEGRAFTFYVNVDNLYIRTDMKTKTDEARLIEAKFVYGSVLVGLALIHDGRDKEHQAAQQVSTESSNGSSESEKSLADRVRSITRALAPFLVPMIDNLGALTDDVVTGLAQQGDES